MMNKYKIFGTVKTVKCNAKLKISEVGIAPIQSYAVRGTVDSKKCIALIRPHDDVGSGFLFEYNDTVVITGKAIESLSSVLTSERTVGFVFESLKKREKGDINLVGVDGKAGLGWSYRFCEIVLA